MVGAVCLRVGALTSQAPVDSPAPFAVPAPGGAIEVTADLAIFAHLVAGS